MRETMLWKLWRKCETVAYNRLYISYYIISKCVYVFVRPSRLVLSTFYQFICKLPAEFKNCLWIECALVAHSCGPYFYIFSIHKQMNNKMQLYMKLSLGINRQKNVMKNAMKYVMKYVTKYVMKICNEYIYITVIYKLHLGIKMWKKNVWNEKNVHNEKYH